MLLLWTIGLTATHETLCTTQQQQVCKFISLCLFVCHIHKVLQGDFQSQDTFTAQKKQLEHSALLTTHNAVFLSKCVVVRVFCVSV